MSYKHLKPLNKLDIKNGAPDKLNRFPEKEFMGFRQVESLRNWTLVLAGATKP